MATVPQRLAVRERDQVNRIRAATAASVARAWDQLGRWHASEVEGFVGIVAPIVAVAVAQVAALVDTVVAMATAAVTGETTLPTGISLPAEIRGVPAAEEWRRPFVATWMALDAGERLEEAAERGRLRSAELAVTDVTLAQRAAMGLAVAGNRHVVGYRRTLTGNSCGLCAAAAGEIYRSQAAPIHVGCDCGLTPVYRTSDPARAINTAATAALLRSGNPAERHLRVVDGGQVALPQYTVHQHGELGPVLAEAHHRFAHLGAA